MDQSDKARLVQSIDGNGTDEEVLEILEALLFDLWEEDAEAISSLGAITTIGSGPISQWVLDEALEFAEADLVQLSAEVWTLILGRREWRETELDNLLRLRSGSTLRVYSHELFVSLIVTGLDPLERPADDIRRDADDHAGLKYLEGVGFDWPTTIVGPGEGGAFFPNALEDGLLSSMDYHVGLKSKGIHHRRAVLRRVLEEKMPKLFPFEHRQQWGEPGSSARLEKTAKTIAWLCRIMKKKPKPSELAIGHWEEDLSWLKSTYYIGRYRFKWPDIEVW